MHSSQGSHYSVKFSSLTTNSLSRRPFYDEYIHETVLFIYSPRTKYIYIFDPRPEGINLSPPTVVKKRGALREINFIRL